MAAVDWSWYDNPFIGSRAFAALITVNQLLNNWNLKTSNNKVYVVTKEDGIKGRRKIREKEKIEQARSVAS